MIIINLFFYLNKSLPNVQLESILDINPGLGGTDYAYINLAVRLSLLDNFNVKLFTKSTINFNNITVENDLSIERLLSMVKKSEGILILNHGDLLINGSESPNLEIFKKLDDYNVKIITICHNHIKSKFLDAISSSKSIKLNVFVGKQFFDYYYDHKIILKSTYIFNLVPLTQVKSKIRQGNNVLFLAGLTPYSGFHVMAKAWKRVIRKIPDAKLFVMGDSLRNVNHKLGKYNIAKDNYEKIFIKHILDQDNNLMESIKFLGWVNDKSELYNIARVAVAKPTKTPETFNLAAVEFQAQGIPVIAPNAFSFVEVISPSKPNLLFNYEKKLAKKIIEILRLSDVDYLRLSDNVSEFVRRKFDSQLIIDLWKKNLINIHSEKKVHPEKLKYSTPIFVNLKYLKIINRILQDKVKFKSLSVLQVLEMLYALVKKPLRMIRKTYLTK